MEQRRQLTPEQDALEHIVYYKDKLFLEERFIDCFKGRGVFTNKTIEPSTFVVEYRGIILCRKKPKPRKYDTVNKYLYEFTWKGAQWCTDASTEDGTLGRLVNDDNINPNCEMKKIEWEGKPHLCLFSVKKISPGEEITYNYGHSSYPWRSLESCVEPSTSNTDRYDTSPTSEKKHEDTSHSEEFGSVGDKIPESEQSHGSDGSDNESVQESPVQEDEASEGSEPCSDEDYEPDEADLSTDDDNPANEHKQKAKGLSITKKNFCYVCGKGLTKISRHLFKHAKDEPDIAEAFALPKKSKERKNLLNELRNRGNYKHNQEVFRKNSGDLKPKRRPTATKFRAKAYVHCLYCRGMFSRAEMWRHVARCPKKVSHKVSKPGKKRVLNQIDAAESSLPENSQSDVWKLLSAMKQDETAFVIQNDNLLLQLARYLLEKYGSYQKEMRIRQRLREMGRLLLALHEKSIFSFEEAIKPKNFYKVVETIKGMACFSEKTQSYKKPSLAIKLGHSLKNISTFLLNRTDNNEQTVADAKTFVALCAEEWNELVSHTAYASLNARNVNCPSTIPFTQDVQAFYMYLEATSASAIASIKMYESPQVYNALCRVTLAQAFVLNKGAYEVSRMTLKSFQESGDTTQVLSKNFIRINIPSKNGQNVAVLLTSELVNAITLLVSKRMSCGVHRDNPFLFAQPDGSDSSLYHGAGCSRSFASLSNAKKPAYLRSTRFQKHITRIFQILNLENDELSHLAKLLGCDIRTDRDYYRSPEAAVDLAKIAKLLLAKEKGSLERFEGNSLGEIEIEDKLEPDVEKCSVKTSDVNRKNDVSDIQQRDDRQLTPKQDALEHIRACKDKPFLGGKYIDAFKGRGVFTHKSIEPSAFVVEYRGNILTCKETKKKKCGDALENYLFDFSWNGTNWCIDASEEDGSLGRLVNDDHITPNCEMKKIEWEGKPHLCLFALKKISAGEEMTYNYGDLPYPWRSMEPSEKQKTSQTDVKATASFPGNERAEDSSSADSCYGDDYVPDDPSSDDDSSSNNRQQPPDISDISDFTELGSSKQQSKKSIDDSSIQQENEEANLDENPSYTNRNHCYVCGKAQSKLARHLFTHRKQEAEIAEVFALPRRSKERKIRLQKLRNRGNDKHNQEVLKTGRGELKVRKRKNLPTLSRSCASCIYCKGMYDRREMWQHLQKCLVRKALKPPTATNNENSSLVATTVTTPQDISADVKEILKTLKNDEISSAVWNDFYILHLAQYLCQMKAKKIKHKDLKRKLRDMGRLLVTLRKKAICSFEEALKPKNFSKVVEAVREISGFNGETNSSDRSAAFVRLGRSLRKMGNMKYHRALKEDADVATIQEAETFMALCAKEWMAAPLSKLKANTAPNIPFTHDVQLFYQYLETTAASAVSSLTMYESAPVYIALLRVTVALVSVLNKSASDVSRITLQSFNEREETELQEDAAVCQSHFEQILCKRFMKIKLMSKCGKKAESKKVVVALTPELLNAITLLVHKREACGVHKNNPFLFARPVNICTSFFQGHVCINTLVPRCGAKNLENLRSQFFRKHMAKIFQILSLTNDELGHLAKLLGRDMRTDREYYQMPEAAVDIARILQLLSAMEKGCLEKFEGKSLEEIEIEDELQPDLEYDKPDGDDEEAESSVQSSGPSSSRRSVSSTKKKGCSMRKRGRPRTRRPESGSEESEPCDEENDENTPKEDRTEDMPVKKAEETQSPSKENATSIYFSEDDDDNYMNMDFDLDTDTDEGGGNYESDKDGDSVGLTLMPVKTSVKETANQNKDISDNKTKDSSSHKHNTDTELKETMDVEAENDVDQEEEQTDRMDVDSSSSSAILDADELRPDLEYDKPDGDNEDNEKAATSVQSSGPSSSRCSVLSTKKEGLSMRKRGRPRTRRLESRSEESEPCDEENDESTLKEDKTEDMPVKKAEETLFPNKEDATKVYFNDDDDDDDDDDDYMNVDVYSDIDADDGDGKYEDDKEFSSEQAFIDDSSIQQENEEANLDENTSYTNRNHCYVCGKAQSKLARHLFTHRKQEAEIAEVFALPRRSKERKIRLQKLRNRGNDKHNQEVLKTGRGELKVRKRKNMPALLRSCAPCIYCKGMYDRREMWQHLQKCLVRKSQKPPTATNNENSSLVATTVTTPQDISADVKEILKTLKNDEISSAVWNDFYILHLAQYLCQMKAKKIKHKDLKRKLRDMGRLLVTLRKKAICSFEEALKPKNFSKVVEAVREISGFNGETNSSDGSAAFVRLGRSLRKMGNMKYHRALKEDADVATIQEAETFMALCAKEWMAAPLSKLKANTAPNIPFTHDVQLFYQYLETTAASAVSSLTMYESAPVYIALLRVTVALVSVLNKSASDVSRITLQSFNEREETELQEDAAVCQSQFEQILCKRFMKIKLMSKCGKKAESKKVVVALTPELLNAITLLVHKREACGVHKNNPFLFARPVNICTSFFQGHVCINTLVPRCGAKNLENLRSQFFRKHMAKIFQILSLTNDELGHLAKLLGRDMRTDREYYQMPEAAVDIARILQLLSATEKGCLEKFEGKSLEEIEIEDELLPDLECDKPDGDNDKEGNEEAESSVQSGGPSSSRRSVSSTKKKVFSMRKRGRHRTRRPESGSEESEPCDEENDENTPKEDRTEDMPVKKAEETQSPSKENATSIYFSDDDDDNYMNMDFDLDTDTDEGGGNYESDEDGDSVGLALMPVKTSVKETANQNKDISDNKTKDSSSHKHNTDTELKETMDVEAENDVDQEEEQTDQTDVDSSSSSAILDAEKKNKLSAAMTGMKELKILIPKLEIENIQGPIHISRLPYVCRRLLGKDQLLQKSSNKYEMSSPSADIDNKSSDAKDIEMMCSFCKKPMMKGQTAYQKKGFKDVFCSKNCLFEMFPMNRQTTKTCHYCLRSITQLLDLIMAVVDTKGTMKDFCSITCLTSYKSNTGSTQVAHLLCSTCNKSCPAACELTLNEAVHKFCSDSCLEDFRRDKMGVCENCSSPCLKKLVLKLEGEPKTICTERCLDHFKEILLQNIKTPQPCTMCHTTQPVPDMVVYKSSSDTMELFCSRNCVTSYKLGSTLMHKLQGKTGSDQMKKTKRGIPLEQTLNTEDVNIRSDSTSSCPAEKHPEIQLVTKSCYNCFRVIMRPHNIILAPVDDSGTMKELCSETCLASVNSKRSLAATKPLLPLGPHLECKMCNRYCYCKFRLMLDGIVHGLCTDTCLTNFRKVNTVPLLTCDVCSNIHLDRQFELKMEDSSKNICSEECLVKFKGKVTKPQLCLMCQTSHQMSDMVENKNQDSSLNFFCSNRCMMVYKASFLTATEKRKPSCEQNDLKEVKPPPHFFIKEEPIDDEYNQKVALSVSTLDIKSEPSVAKEDLKISSIFSLTGVSKPAAPTVTHEDVPASCSNCKNILMDGETVYQRKGHADVFCSTSCLLKFYHMKPVKKTCQFCLQVIPQPQDAIQALVDSNGATKDFCSQACLSAFNYKTMMSTKIPIVPVGLHSQCNMCSRYSISKHEFIQDDCVYKMCSEPCLNRFCNLNKLSICENCHYCCKNPLMLKVEHRTKKVCSAACLAQVKKKVKAHQPCAMCHTSKLVTEMIENKNSEEELELFCTSSCLMASKIQAISASGTALNCDNCGKLAVPACHLAMSNGSIRNFCTLTCAMAFKEAQKDRISATNSTGVPNQTQCDLFKTPEKLLCARCQRAIGSTPKVIQTKDKINFVCSLACSQEFKRVNNITGMCAFCKNERIITDTKRIDGKDCYFCSDGCKMLYRDKLEKSWGKHCCPCAYCHSIATTVVTAKYDDKEERFCSEVCSSNFKMLFYCVAKCDACSQAGKLRQSLPMLGQVKHFCDLKCLLHFCNKKIQAVDTDSSPPRSSAAVDSPPVIANVISLASALGRRPSASSGAAQHGSVIQTKVVGHASIQTVPKELKNKSMLCTPLVHNKGVCCTTQTVDSEAQTDGCLPKVLPVPVPVYVPLPMTMYSQYTPKPVGLPLPLPVPVFFPVTLGGYEAAVKERIQPETVEGKSGMETKLKERTGGEGAQEGREMVKEGKRQETQTLTVFSDRSRGCSHDLEKEGYQEEICPQSSLKSQSLQHTSKESPPVSGVGVAFKPQPELSSPASPDSLSLPNPAPGPTLQILGKVNNKNKGAKLQQMPKAEHEASQEDSEVMSRRHQKLKSQSGIDAWKRWIRWRTSQTNVDPDSSHAVKLKENILQYSAAELSSSLCCFIKEVKRPDGKSYSPNSLFFLCLGIQQYLFENGRMENIFSDLIYTKFSTEFTNTLKHFNPLFKASGYVHSPVEEEYLWECKQLGAYSPLVLLNTLLFFCCKYVGFTRVEEHRQLSFANIMRCTKTNSNNTKTMFLRFYLPVSLNEAEPDADGVPAKKRKKNENKKDFLEMMENTKNALRCPVRLYEFYLSKCPESVRQRSDFFYLQPDHCCLPSSPLWFSSTPLDDSTMEAMLLRILTVRQLQRGEGDRGGMD